MSQVTVLETAESGVVVRIRNCNYLLARKTKKQINALRQEGRPLLIVKENGILYAGTIYGMYFNSNSGHLCSRGGETCDRLSAKTDEEGGCRKVRQRSRGIEVCDFITRGFEAVHTEQKCDCLVVEECENFRPSPKDKSLSPLERQKSALALMQEIVPDILTYEELRRRISRNEAKMQKEEN